MKRIFAILISFITLTVAVGAQNAFVGDWSGELNVMGAKLKMVFHISADNDAAPLKATLDVPEQSAKGIPSTITTSADSLTINVPMIGAKYAAKLVGNELRGKFFQNGLALPLNLAKGAEKLQRSQNPQPPFPYSTKDVTFVNAKAGATLAGTLTYPIGYDSKKAATTPVAIMVTGSGQQNRDEELFEHRPFAVIADYLARNGIATLRYDDRGVGESKGGLTPDVTSRDFADDALAGIEYLRNLGEFGKVGIIGHSEGGMIAFMLGAENMVDFIVSLAGPGAKGSDVIMSQVRRQIENSPMAATIPDIDAATKQNYEIVLKQMQSAWLTFFLNYDPVPDIRACRCPVLAMNGSLDSQVISSLNLPLIKANLSENPQNEVVEFEGLNHLFQHCTIGAATEYYNIEETFAPEALDAIVKFINKINK